MNIILLNALAKKKLNFFMHTTHLSFFGSTTSYCYIDTLYL